MWSVLRVFVGGFVDWWMGWWVALVSSLTLCYGSAMRVSGCVPTVPCACVWEGVGSSVLDLILQLVAQWPVTECSLSTHLAQRPNMVMWAVVGCVDSTSCDWSLVPVLVL